MVENFITVKNFSNQSDKVQNTLMEWWEPKYGDLYSNFGSPHLNIVLKSEDEFILSTNNTVWDEKINCIPILQIHHLIQFIENKQGILDINMKGEYIIATHDDEGNIINVYKKLGNGLLEALWQVVCKIAEES